MTPPTPKEWTEPPAVVPYDGEPEASVKLRQFVVDGYDGTMGTSGEGGMRIGGRVSDVTRYIDTLAAERDAAIAKRDASEKVAESYYGDAVGWELRASTLQADNDALRAKLDALTPHMQQVHDVLGGTDTVLTLEAAQHVVAKLDAAERRALNLLAVVHRDGGQHTSTVGFAASFTEAEAVVVALRAKCRFESNERGTTDVRVLVLPTEVTP
jgi:hypothetical protein